MGGRPEGGRDGTEWGLSLYGQCSGHSREDGDGDGMGWNIEGGVGRKI
jgi:hypothetical protein